MLTDTGPAPSKQVASGDSWASVVTRGLMEKESVQGYALRSVQVLKDLSMSACERHNASPRSTHTLQPETLNTQPQNMIRRHGCSPALVAVFFSSYVLIVGVVLMNIVVAVLLDEVKPRNTTRLHFKPFAAVLLDEIKT